MNKLIVVAIVVYDRFENVKEWVRCWNLCETQQGQLVIIHNYKNENEKEAYQQFCNEAGISYVPRINQGFDIGALQDVSRGRLEGFPKFDYLLWCTDDVFPMRKNFLSQYIDMFSDDVGCVAMEISKEVKTHIRTTAFCMPNSLVRKLQFPADPVLSKWDCYLFEHRHATDTLMQQVEKKGLKALQVAPLHESPFWDSEHKKTPNRMKEHFMLFPKTEQSPKKIVFICPVYNSYPEIIGSLINQTHHNWELHLIHDGPSKIDIHSIVEAANDKRINYVETKNRSGNWGHSIRRDWIQKMKGTDADYIVVTNADNHHVPTYCEYMLKGFTNGQVAVFCSQMTHSYIAHNVINCRPQQGYMDSAGVMVRADVSIDVGWNDVKAHSADWLYFADIIEKHGVEKFGMVKGNLLVHN